MSDAAAAQSATAIPAAIPARSAWRSPGGFGFRDILDIVNPLQHLPVITSIYRWVTGDRPGEAAEVAGDALYGGPIGVAFGLVGAATEDSTGHDLGERVLTKLFGPGRDTPATATATAASGKTAVAAVAAPTRSPASAIASTAAPMAVADHAPMPLFGHGRIIGAGAANRAPMPLYRAGPAAAASTTAVPDAARGLIAHNARIEREIGSGVHAGPPGAPMSMALPPRTLPSGGGARAPSSVPVPLVLPPGTLPSGGAGLAHAPVAPSAATPDMPVNIPQKMLDALDKYRRLEEDRKAAAPSPTPGVDLAL